MDTDSKKRRKEDEEDDDNPSAEKKVTVGELEVNQEDDEWQAHCEYEEEHVVDEKSGVKLDSCLVKVAEEEEMSYMEEIGVGEFVPEGECEKETYNNPVTTKWVRINRATLRCP